MIRKLAVLLLLPFRDLIWQRRPAARKNLEITFLTTLMRAHGEIRSKKRTPLSLWQLIPLCSIPMYTGLHSCVVPSNLQAGTQ